MMNRAFPILASALALSVPIAAAAAPAKPAYGSFGIDLATGDPTVKPGDSFFDRVNGGWYRTTQVGADKMMAGIGMELVDRTQVQLRTILEASIGKPAATPAGKVGGLYASYM